MLAWQAHDQQRVSDIGAGVAPIDICDIAALHASICSFKALGFQRLTNDPWNDRLRLLYASFGFETGEVLNLNDPAALTSALTVIARAYRRFDIDLSGPPP